MMLRATKVKLVAFAVIAVAAVSYVGGKYAGLDQLLGARGYVVTVQLADSGGVFRGSEVTYRGVTVGNVRTLRLTDTGIDAELDISSDAPPIPADSEAVVANRSPVGEQYIDMRPEDSAGPYLEDGSIIEQDRTGLPIAPDTVLASLDRLVSSVNIDSLRVIVDESYQAFAGVGPDLQVLLDNAHSFTVTARENVEEIQQLLSSARTVMDTQVEHAGDLEDFASGLRTISEQFADSDADLRAVIDRASPVGQQVSDFLAVSGNDLGMLLANLLTTAEVAAPRTDALEQLLVNFAVIGAFAPTVAKDGRGQLGLVFDNFNPPSCTRGYEGTRQRPANELTDVEPNKDAYCAEPPGSPVGVRGAQNAPYGGVPAEVDAPEESGSGDDAPELPGMLGARGSQQEPGGMAGLLGAP